MSAVGVPEGITRYVWSPGVKSRSPRTCTPAVVTMASRHAASGFAGRTKGAVSLTCAGNVSRLFREIWGRRSSRGIADQERHTARPPRSSQQPPAPGPRAGALVCRPLARRAGCADDVADNDEHPPGLDAGLVRA